ncbi:cell wall-binding repeat-containing protein [Peptostreptococcus anaerobius]|uniref:cell wall-binding repeat-containing protein n=1 Tax=Peptostreptococcus anaerobius TaxID=1261 RepID=UPI0032193ABE
MNLKSTFMNLFRENVNISKKISVGLLSFMIMLSSLTPVVNANYLPSTGVSEASQVRERGGLAPVDIKKWVGDTVDWKDGVKAKDSVSEENKAKINELLKGAKFEEMSARNTNEASRKKGKTDKASREEEGFKGNIKVRFKDGSKLTVENQILYVSDFITPSSNENAPTDAIEVEFKLGEGVKVEEKDTNSGKVTKKIEGDKTNPVLYKKYKVKPNTDLLAYKYPVLGITIFALIDETAKDGYTEPVWNDKNKGINFKVTAENNVFTATATKTFKVTVKANGGTGNDIEKTVKKGETYTLPAKNTFTPPNDDQEFSGWKIGDDTNLKQPNETTTITGDTVINAIWKPIEFKVAFKRETGASGNMDPVTVTKGSEYQLPQPTFKPDQGKEFAGWLVNGVAKKVGDKITVNGNTTVTAKYKTISKPGSKDKKPGTPDVNPSKPGSKDKKPGTSGVNPSKPGSKDKKPDTGRIAGNNRYETSAKISQKYFKSADTVVLASGKNNADALVSASFANLKKAPILLTDTYSTDDSVVREIERLKAKNVIIVGGASSVGHSVETNMKSKGYNVRRLSGATRYETSAMIAQEVKDATGSNKAILINGSKEADALTVSSLATKKDLPVIMAKSNGIDRFVKDKLDSWNLQEIYVVGGVGSLPNSVVDKAKASNKKRIAGRDRYQTAMKIAEESYPNADRYMIANAYNPIDALSAGAVTAKANMPILLVNKANIPQGVKTKLDKKAKGVILLGGENTLTTNILNNISLVD